VTVPDALRILGLALFALVAGQALVINLDMHRLRKAGAIRPPALLAWHVHAVTVYAIGMHAVLAFVHVRRLGEDHVLSWHLYLLLVLGVAGNISMLLIGRVMAARKALARAARR
jgi:hypothetical protein